MPVAGEPAFLDRTDELAKLDVLAAYLAGDRPRPARYCFSPGGFTRQLSAAARRDPELTPELGPQPRGVGS